LKPHCPYGIRQTVVFTLSSCQRQTPELILHACAVCTSPIGWVDTDLQGPGIRDVYIRSTVNGEHKVLFGGHVYGFLKTGNQSASYRVGIGVKFPAGAYIFLFSTDSRLILEPTLLSIQWVEAFSSWGSGCRSVKLIIHLPILLGLRLRGDIPPLPMRLRGIVIH
jgi:hypothetical protein